MALGFKPTDIEFLVNTETTYNQRTPEITSLKNGGYVIVWESDALLGSGFNVSAQIYSADGTPIGSEFQVNTPTDGDQDDHSITALENGGFVISYHSEYDGDATQWGYHVRVYDADGTPASPDVTIRIHLGTAPVVAGLSDGNFIVISHLDYGIGLTLMGKAVGQIYDTDGNKVGARFDISVGAEHVVYDFDMTTLTDGGFVVTWTSSPNDSDYTDVYGQRLNVDGTKVGSEFLVNTYVDRSQKDAHVTALHGGGFVVAYTSQGFTGGLENDVVAQIYDANGAPVGDEFMVNTTADIIQDESDISALPDGGFVVVWKNNSTSDDGIYAQRYDARGNEVGGEYKILLAPSIYVTSPSVAVLADGSFVVSWEREGDVYARSFAAQLYGTASDDVLSDTVGANWISGRGGNDTLRGNAGKDTLQGDTGSDTLLGNGGRDKLFGGRGNDILNGGAQKDKLWGNGGKDTMTGGSGADTFIFTKASDSLKGKADIITDFASGVDKLDLSALAVGSLTFIGASGFSGTGAEVRASHTTSGDILVHIDVDADGSVDMRILLEGLANITTGDFIL